MDGPMMALEERIRARLTLGTERERFVATATEIAAAIGMEPKDVLLCYSFAERERPHVLPELFVSPDSSAAAAARRACQERVELFSKYPHSDGELSLVLATPTPVAGTAQGQELIQACSSPAFQDMQRLAYVSHRKDFMNPETGFPNRTGLRNFFEQTIYRKQFRKERASKSHLIFIDLNDFKDVNDQLGHPKGDEVLRALERILIETSEWMPHNSTYIARIGGDEYVFAGAADQAEAGFITENIQSRLGQQIVIGSHIMTGVTTQVRVKASFGAATYGMDDSFEETMKRADRLMYQAKEESRTGERRREHRTD